MEIDKALRDLCDRKSIESIVAQCRIDDIHMLMRVPPKYSMSEMIGYLKGKSEHIFDR